MISTLADIVAPLTVPQFAQRLAARTLTLQRGGAAADRFAGLLGWAQLRGLLESGGVPVDKITLTRERQGLMPFLYRDGDKVNGAKLDTFLRTGASVVVERFEASVPALKALCDDIAAQLGEEIWATAIATSGTGGAFKPHYDSIDLIIFQLEGSKRWKVYSPTIVYPTEMMPPAAVPSEDLVFDEILEPGDFLFLPAGYWHSCENGPGLSLHGVISFNPPNAVQAVRALLREITAEQTFRVPLTRLGGPAQQAAHEAALKALLIEKIGKLSMAELQARPPADQPSAVPLPEPK